MVENWKKLRLSLFKWGTFLGGGGGSALWAMFGSGNNWGRLAELMGDPKFQEALGTLSELMSENSDTFSSMSQEDVESVIEKILEDPGEANEIGKELLKEQKELNKEKSEQEEKKQLESEKIAEAFSKQEGGKPQDTNQALGDMIAAGLKKLKSNSFGDAFEVSKKAMEEHIKHLEKESQRNTKTAEVKKEFLAAINESKESFISALARLSARAYSISNDTKNEKQLASIFEQLMKEEFTKEVGENEEGDASIDGIVMKSLGK